MKESWNTWNVRSVLSHVHLPDGIAISLGIKEYSKGQCLREALIGRENGPKTVIPGPHAYDGSYTSLIVEWFSAKLQIETAVENDEWYALVTPLKTGIKTEALTIEGAVLWNRPGFAKREQNTLIVEAKNKIVTIQASGTHNSDEPVVDISSPYLLVSLNKPVCISTNSKKLSETSNIIAQKRDSFLASRHTHGKKQEVYDAMQICLAWDTIYDPSKDRIISPVSRLWCCYAGGWVLFDWDTYFAAWMASEENKELAYANAIAITDEATEEGFIPNVSHPGGFKSFDRSQPPVGSITVQAICKRFNETILAEQLFDALMKWNRWWPENRDKDGYLCWGSNPYEPIVGNPWETKGVNDRFGGALESGLDNSPMYDDISFDHDSHLLLLADVGLMSLYIADCNALADLAEQIGRNNEANELQARSKNYTEKLKEMWCEDVGLFLNKNLSTGEYCQRLSPTHFYPLIARVATQQQAERMINEHFFNKDEFWGEWILPSIARNDPAYPDQDYWRGRIWAPMNFLVYLGLCNYDLEDARTALVEKSEALLLKEWREYGHVHENYCADTGIGCDKPNSDKFYHWGGLLGLISIIDNSVPQKS